MSRLLPYSSVLLCVQHGSPRSNTWWCLLIYDDGMHRTQIYLDEHEVELLAQESARPGASRSELIRRAMRTQYGSDTPEGRLAALRSSAGTWSDRSGTGAEYVEDLRGDLSQRLEQVSLG